MTSGSVPVGVGHDVVVVGASAGGLQPLQILLGGLPRDLPASVFIVVHRTADPSSMLSSILGRETTLRVVDAVDRMAIERGVAYLAPPDLHLLVHERIVRVVRGPRENRHRPAVDPLFRSAAWAHGPRVVGVLLSGALNDGTAGLWAIRTCGGAVVVQDPADAQFSGMPTSALESLEADYRVPVADMPAIVRTLAATPADLRAVAEVPEQIKLESAMAELHSNDMRQVSRIGAITPYTCAQCHGALWEIDDANVLRFRCHTGHAFTAESLVADQEASLEDALYSAVRALEENAAVSRRLAERARLRHNEAAARSFTERAERADASAATIAQLYGEPRERVDDE